ncbi:MAG: sugar phosphate isomerase/epimerase [Niabella sp.]
MKILPGVQIWSLRNLISDNAAAVFKKLATTGYTFIEPAGFNLEDRTIQGFSPKELRTLAGHQGLKIYSGHFQFLPEDTHAVCECAAEAGMQYIVCSYLREEQKVSIESYKAAADELNEVGALVKMYDLQLVYHNHAYEFDRLNGEIPFNLLLKNTDPQNVVFQPDLGWMVYANQSPVDYFDQYPGRFPLWHLRDIDAGTGASTTVGKGMVDFVTIFKKKALAGLKYPVIEVASGVDDPLQKITQSFSFVQNRL